MQSTQAVVLRIGPLRIRAYALCIVAGLLLALLTAKKREKRFGLPNDTALDLVLWCVPCAILGARLYYVLFSQDAFRSRPLWHVFAVWEGGLAVFGGLIAGIAAGLVYARRRKLPAKALLDLAAPCIALGQCVGRWGNFFNREAYGRAVESARWQFFPVAVSIDGAWHCATFFYESLWCLFIALALLALERRMKRCDGFWLYALWYASERFVVEGLRTDSLYFGAVRVSQALSLVCAAAVLCVFAARHKKLWVRIPAALYVLAGIAGLAIQSEALVAAVGLFGVLAGTALWHTNKEIETPCET